MTILLVLFNITTLGKINTDRTQTKEPDDVTFMHQRKLKCKDWFKYVILIELFLIKHIMNYYTDHRRSIIKPGFHQKSHL